MVGESDETKPLQYAVILGILVSIIEEKRSDGCEFRRRRSNLRIGEISADRAPLFRFALRIVAELVSLPSVLMSGSHRLTESGPRSFRTRWHTDASVIGVRQRAFFAGRRGLVAPRKLAREKALNARMNFRRKASLRSLSNAMTLSSSYIALWRKSNVRRLMSPAKCGYRRAINGLLLMAVWTRRKTTATLTYLRRTMKCGDGFPGCDRIQFVGKYVCMLVQQYAEIDRFFKSWSMLYRKSTAKARARRPSISNINALVFRFV